MKLKLNEIVSPLIKDLNKSKEKKNYKNISKIINKMKINSENLLDKNGSRSGFIANIEYFVESNENLMSQIMEISNNSENLENIINNC